METITAEELKALLDQKQAVTLIDVREPWEFNLCHIAGSKNVPMTEIVGEMEALDRSRDTVVICHYGARSQQVGSFLDSSGFQSVFNLEGGIDAWASRIDTGMSRY